MAWLVAVPHARVKAVRARSRTSLDAPGARSGQGLYIPAANDPRSSALSAGLGSPTFTRGDGAQLIGRRLHKKLSLKGALCAKPAEGLDKRGAGGEDIGAQLILTTIAGGSDCCAEVFITNLSRLSLEGPRGLHSTTTDAVNFS